MERRRRRLPARRGDWRQDRRSVAKSQVAELVKSGASTLHRRRPSNLRRVPGRRPGARAAVRRPGHARDARKPRARPAKRSRRGPATARSRCRSSSSSTPAHQAPPSCSPPRSSGNKRAELIGEHTIGRAGAAAADQAAGRHAACGSRRPVTSRPTAPHSTKKASNRPSPWTNRKSTSVRRLHRAIPFSKKPSSARREKKAA